jgi:Mor family transcriptional regulator
MPNTDTDPLGASMTALVGTLTERLGDSEEARELAELVEETIRRDLGGNEVYIRQVRYREEDVLADFCGNNAREVCARHHISRATLYRVLNRRRCAPRSAAR